MEAENEYKKGLWTKEEDRVLLDYVTVHGSGRWNRIPKLTGKTLSTLCTCLICFIFIIYIYIYVGLKRNGKSCRLRWINYLNPNVKRGDFSEEEEDLIIRLHNLLGNRFSEIYLHLSLFIFFFLWGEGGLISLRCSFGCFGVLLIKT